MDTPTRILIVEDERIVAQDIQITLERLGYSVTALASTGEDAINAAAETPPDLILMDIMLQVEMTGIQAARAILDRQNLPVIYLTAYADRTTLESAKLTQPYGYILKPFEEQELHTTIEMALYKHKMERALVEQEKLLSITLQSIGDAVITADREGRITFINDAALKLSGKTRETTDGRAAESVLRLKHADTGAPITPVTAALSGAGEDETRMDAVCECDTGETIPVTFRTALITNDGGDPAGVVLTVRDNTHQWQAREALKRSEEHYRNLVEKTPISIIIHINNKVTFINHAAVSMFGASGRDELLGRDIHEFIDSSYRQIVDSRIRELKEAPRHLPTIKERFLRLDGTPFDVEVSAVAFHYEGEEAVFVVAHDITERTRLEEELRQSHKMEAIGRLAGGIAHDFNNLLTAIIGYSDLGIGHLKEEDPLYSEMEQIRKAANRAATLTRQLLAFSRRQVLQPRVINLNSIILDMEKLLRRVIGENIDLEAVYEEELDLILADAGQIQQVIMNLCINARDAMSEGGRLTIRTENGPETGDESGERLVQMTVRDTGTGISPELLDQIFEPFFTTKQPGEGTGLGLATVYGIVKQSGGDVQVESVPGEGTEFRIFFPVSTAKPQEQGEIPPESARATGSETILLVEDEEMVRSLAATILTQSGYRVHEAGNGREAVHMLDHIGTQVDLLITDLIMPGIDGSELKNIITERSPGTRVIFMSGYTDKGPTGSTSLEPGVPFLQKPFTLHELVNKVRDVLDSR